MAGGFGAADPASRGMAWAFQQAMGLVWYYLDSNPTMSRWGMRTLDRMVDAWGRPSEDHFLLESDRAR